MKKYNHANTTGYGHETALGLSVSSTRAFFPAGRRRTNSWDVNRGRAADVAPGPVSPLLLVFSPQTWSLPPEEYPRQHCQTGASRRFLAREGRRQLRRGKGTGETEKEAPSLTRCAGVRRGTMQRRRNRSSALLNLLADFSLVRPRGRPRRGDNKGEFADTATSPNFRAAIALHRSWMKTATGHTGEATAPGRRLVRLFRACLRFSPGRSIPPNNKPSWAG